FDETRRNRVHRNSPGAHLPRHGSVESENTSFGRRVQRLPHISHLPHHRCDIYYPSVTLSDHNAGHGFSTENGARQTGSDDLIATLRYHANRELIIAYAGIVDH